MENYATKSGPELTVIYNELRAKVGEQPIKRWAGPKAELIAKIEVLELRTPKATAATAPEATAAPEHVTEKPKAKQKPAKKQKTEDGRTIREASLDLLAHVDFYEDKTKASNDENRVAADHKNARSVGLAYLEVIERVKLEFPDADTSVACLRWYSVKVRDSKNHPEYAGWKLPQRRPRATPKK